MEDYAVAAGEGEEKADEEECSAEFQPVVQLQEVETVSGEEAENILTDL
jgi:Ran-binding protein 1